MTAAVVSASSDRVRRHIWTLWLVLLVPIMRVQAQDPVDLRPTPDSMVAQITLRDGSTLLGRVLEVTSSSVRFASAVGESTIPRSTIVSVRLVHRSGLHEEGLWPEDPSRTRLLFAPTGRMMRSDETYFTEAELFFPSFQFGITDRISMGVGASVFPGVGIADQIFYVTPKVGVYQSPNVNVAVGALIAGAKWLVDQSPVGIGYGVATLGSEDNSLTVGGGVGYGNKKAGASLLMVGGTTRVSKGISLVTENYADLSNGGALWSGGVRFIGERLSVDAALFGVTSAAVAIPYLAFIYRY